MSTYIRYPSSTAGTILTYATFSAFPSISSDGQLAEALDTNVLYAFNLLTSTWRIIGGPGSVLSLGNLDAQAGSAKGAAIVADVLSMQSASATVPGLVNTTTQTMAGAKTFSTSVNAGFFSGTAANPAAAGTLRLSNTQTISWRNFGLSNDYSLYLDASNVFQLTNALTVTGNIAATNFSGSSSGTNTGDVTLTAVGSTPGANGASLSGQALTLQPADATNPGVVTAAAQSFGGSKTFVAATSIAAGSVSLAGLYLSTDTTSGLYRIGVNQIGVTISAAKVLTIGTSGLAVVGSITSDTSLILEDPGAGTNTTTIQSGTVSGSYTLTLPTAVAASSNSVFLSSNAGVMSYAVAASANTASAIVQRDGSGNFSAGTVSAALTGTASGNTTYTPSNHGMIFSSATNAMTVLAPDASTVKCLVSGGSSADPSWQVLALGGGGTGQVTKAAAFDALSPMSAGGDLIYGGTSGTGTRLPNGNSGQILQSAGSTSAPTWSNSPQIWIGVTASKVTTYAIANTDGLVIVDGSGGGFSVTLPTAASITGKIIRIKRIDSTLANAVTIATTSSQTIDGVTTRLLSTQYEEFVVCSDGSNWYILDHLVPGGEVNYGPTFTGFGTVSNVNFWYKRIGDGILINGRFTTGTTTNVTAKMTIPSGISIDNTKRSASYFYNSGLYMRSVANASSTAAVIIDTNTSTSVIFFSSQIISNANNPTTAVTGSTLAGSSEGATIQNVYIPISGWEG